jgi:hypothetical protein
MGMVLGMASGGEDISSASLGSDRRGASVPSEGTTMMGQHR